MGPDVADLHLAGLGVEAQVDASRATEPRMPGEQLGGSAMGREPACVQLGGFFFVDWLSSVTLVRHSGAGPPCSFQSVAASWMSISFPTTVPK